MANLPEVIEWLEGIYQIETTDYVEGGATGVANLQAKQLRNCLLYLKDQLDTLEIDPADLTADFLLPIVKGGTGANTAAGARISLGIADLFSQNYLHVCDEKSSGTNGGSFYNNAWRTRTLNTEKTNSITDASLASDQITLPAGTYRIRASAPAYDTDRHKLKLYNVTDGSDEIIGSVENNAISADSQTRSVVVGEFAIPDTKVFELRHWCSVDNSFTGFGKAFSSPGVIEVYSIVEIWKVA